MMADNIVELSEYSGAPGAVPPPLSLLTLAELRAQFRAVPWLVKHAVPADSIGVIYGGSGTFKSFIAIDLAMHVAHGMEWLGKKTKKGPVLIIAAEGGAGLWRRIYAWHKHRRIPYADIDVRVLPMAIDLATEASRVTEAASKAGMRPELVVIDTMSQTFSGEENSAAEVSQYLRGLGLWFRAVWQATVLVVHHTGHRETERARGSSAIRDNVDFMYSVFRDEKEMLATIENVKQKDGELLEPTTFDLRVVDISFDDDGDKITSLVASQVGTAEVVDAMRYEAERGRGGSNNLFLELALNGIREKELRTVFCEAIDGDAETKRMKYYRARKWALRAGLIEIAQGIVIRLKDSL